MVMLAGESAKSAESAASLANQASVNAQTAAENTMRATGEEAQTKMNEAKAAEDAKSC